MREYKIGTTFFELRTGDIANQPDMEAVVNAANAALRTGGGVAGAIHRAAGPGLEKECLPLAPIKPGQAVITGAHRLPNKFVIHCLGPVYGVDKPEDQLLAACYQNALLLAEKRGIASVAFPAISTGIFGYPVQEAASVAIDTMAANLLRLTSVSRVVMVLHSESSFQVHEEYLNQIKNV